MGGEGAWKPEKEEKRQSAAQRGRGGVNLHLGRCEAAQLVFATRRRQQTGDPKRDVVQDVVAFVQPFEFENGKSCAGAGGGISCSSSSGPTTTADSGFHYTDADAPDADASTVHAAIPTAEEEHIQQVVQ